MGAESFVTRSKGKTAQEAFGAARDEAADERGHGGYTGTIAEKHEFTLIEMPDGANVDNYCAELINSADERIDDKWGPAGCIDLGKGEYVFFGWASS